MAYCRNCGTKLVEGAKFCQRCGCAVGENSTQRNQEFVGKIYKCPNCGESLKSFVTNCPTCGFELRGTKATSAIREFALKLEAIESRREYEKPAGIREAAYFRQRISKTDEQKISLIQSFSVPNTKEDILEFMILATSSINYRSYDSSNTDVSKGEKALNDAWNSKIKQVYTKAKNSYGSDVAFEKIQKMYEECTSNIHKTKRNGIIKRGLLLFAPALALALLGIFLLTLEVLFGPGAEKKEIARLEAIEATVQTALENGEYKEALLNAEGLEYSPNVPNGNTDELERQWDIKRELLIDQILEEAEEAGVDLEYNPSVDTEEESSVD